MASFRRRRNACRLSLRPSASSARARSRGRPRPVGGHFNQCDLIARPGPRRGAVDGECRQPSAILDQRRADERRSLAGEELLALRVRESRIRIDVIDGHRLAAAARAEDGRAEPGDRASTGERRDPVGIGPADDELAAIDVRVVDAAGVEMFPDQADGDVLDLDRVLQGSQLLVERDQEMPLDGHRLRPILVSSEGLRPSDSPTRALARRFAGALRSRGSLAMLARTVQRASGS